LGKRFRKKGVHVGRTPHMHTFFADSSLQRLQPEQLRNNKENLMATQDIFNYIQVNETLATGGQPTEDEIRSAAAEGFTSVINLATLHPGESLEDEAGLVQSLGMAYYAIPVVWTSPQSSDFTAFEQVMLHLPAGKTLIHCAANFRVTAFYSLYALKHLGWSQAQAEAFRAQIWEGSDYPVWEQFIGELTGQIYGQGNIR
jgi:protein tyrosine phosphatase (PTP) superfamily phosphohydrolase (DUF442 family)